MNQPTTNIEHWRQQMTANRIESIGTKAVFFDGSPAGAGKSCADIAVIKQVESSLSILPSHFQCQEWVETLAMNGVVAAAHPPLDETTCQLFGSKSKPDIAQIAQRAGIIVGLAICPECRHQQDCEYQRRRELARRLGHVVSTHARAASGGFEVAAGKEMIFIHEDGVGILRPTLRVGSVAALHMVLQIAVIAKSIAERLGDTQKIDFAATLMRSTKELIPVLSDETLLLAAAEEPTAPRVRSVPVPQRTPRPPRIDMVLFEAMQSASFRLDGDALRLAVMYACGELGQLCVVVEEKWKKGGQRQRSQYLFGVGRVELPLDATIWFEDATGDRALISKLIGRPVEDRTPEGSLPFVKSCRQIVDPDIKMNTAPAVVRAVVRGLIAANPSAVKIGIITLQDHIQVINELEPFWRDRIHRIGYFFSGEDRGSNGWLECDLLIVIGTPRMPPDAIRRHLLQNGQVQDAAQDGDWDDIEWEDSAGEPVESLGYKHPSWDAANKRLVRAALLQAAGRARSILESGIPLIVVSNESIGLEVDRSPFGSLNDVVAGTFNSFVELAVKIPNSIILETLTANSAEKTSSLRPEAPQITSKLVAEYSMRSIDTVRRHLSVLEKLGLIRRVGQRGGYHLAVNPWLKHDH